jgi:hypothetical protein
MRSCPELKYFGDLFGGTVSIWLCGPTDREIKANMDRVWNEH